MVGKWWVFTHLTDYLMKEAQAWSMLSHSINSESENLSHSVMPSCLWPRGLYHNAPLSMRFSRREHWSGLPFSCPADLPNPRTEPRLLHCRQNLYHLNHQGINGQSWNLESIWSLAGWSYDTDILEVIRYMIPLPQATFLGGSDGKESACNARKPGSIPGLERSPGGGHGSPLQYACLETPMDRGAWWTIFHGGAKSYSWASN